MKKIILGLFLTVGVSGMALAENCSNEKALDVNKQTENSEAADSKHVIDLKQVFDCFTSNKLMLIDEYGNKYVLPVFSDARDCRAGEADGTIEINVQVIRA